MWFGSHQNWLVFWFDNKELLSGADAIGWNFLKKLKIIKKNFVYPWFN